MILMISKRLGDTLKTTNHGRMQSAADLFHRHAFSNFSCAKIYFIALKVNTTENDGVQTML